MVHQKLQGYRNLPNLTVAKLQMEAGHTVVDSSFVFAKSSGYMQKNYRKGSNPHFMEETKLI